ncbi:MAG: hypothetical protein NTZ63_02315 [Candidatus Omnitrophica bacterium]|nr:hypothetical protein [Candidatus Omnitrophota bacterium]
MVKKILGIFLVFLFCATGLVFAEGRKPVQFSIFSPIQIFRAKDSIGGLRFNLIYGDNKNMSGITLSTGWNNTSGDMKGVELGAVNWTDGVSYGWRNSLINYTGKRFVGLDIGAVNIVKGDATGVELGIGNWNWGFFHGYQGGVINYADNRFVGWQDAVVNLTKGDCSGLQTGVVNYVGSSMTGLQLGLLWNYAKQMNGLQVGFFNGSDSLNGVQIGLINYNGNCDPMEGMVFVNWSF